MTDLDDGKRPSVPEPGDGIGPVHHHADEVMLFEFSAVTWNPHRVHYDSTYATAVEGLGGLLVTGPLQGALIEHMVTSWAASGGGSVRALEYRHRAPAYAGSQAVVAGVVQTLDEQGRAICEVWVECDGTRTTEGIATVSFDS